MWTFLIFAFITGRISAERKLEYFSRENSTLAGIATKVAYEEARKEVSTGFSECKYGTIKSKANDELICKHMEKSVSNVFLADNWVEELTNLLNITRQLKIPTLTSAFGQTDDLMNWRYLNDVERKFFVQIMNPLDVIPEIARTIAIHQNFLSAVIIYEHIDYVFGHKLKSVLVNLPTRHTIVQMPTTEYRMNDLGKKLDIINCETYFVFGTVKKLETFMNSSVTRGLRNARVWHLITHESTGEIHCNCDNLTIVFIRPKEDPLLNGFIESKKFGTESKLEALFYYEMALNGFRAAAYLPEITYTGCTERNTNNNIDLHGFLKSNWRSSLNNYRLHLVENGKSFVGFTMEMFGMHYLDSKVVLNRSIGTWKAGFGNRLKIIYPRVMEEYSGRQLNMIAVVIQKPFLFPNASAPRNFSGLCVDLMEEIGKIANIRYDLYLPEANPQDSYDYDPYERAVNEVVKGKALMALGSLWITNARKVKVDFSVPFHDAVGITIMMKIPEASTSIFKFITVLDGEVWLCILTAYFFASFILWSFEKFSPTSYRNNGEFFPLEGDERREFTFIECLWFCLNSLTPEGGGLAPGCISGRIVAGTWWLFGFVIIASYTANLAAFLTASSLEAPIESLDDLSKQYQIKYGPINRTSVMTYMENMAKVEHELYKFWFNETIVQQPGFYHSPEYSIHEYPLKMKYEKMWRFINDGKIPQTLDEAVKWVRASRTTSEGFALIADATDIKYLAMTSCDLQVVGDEFSKKPYGIVIQKKTNIKADIDNAVITLMNERVLQSMEKKWWKNNPNVVKCDHMQSSGITIQNILGVFILIGCGVVFGFFVTLMDKGYNRFMKRAKIAPVDITSRHLQ